MKQTPEAMCDDLIAFFSVIKQRLLRFGEHEGLTPVQLGTLYWLHRHGELAMGQIAQVMHCDASNVTGIVDRLVAQELVIRQESARDRRTKTLHLTQKGSQIITRVQQQLPAAIGWDMLTDDECALLHKVAQNARTGSNTVG
jgi:DNA-binding MarR family transcriptional regulator